MDARLEYFTSYELAGVLDHLRDAAAEHADGVAWHALRAADAECLMFMGSDPWRDDHWVAAHQHLRALIAENHSEKATIRQAVSSVTALLELLLARDRSTP